MAIHGEDLHLTLFESISKFLQFKRNTFKTLKVIAFRRTLIINTEIVIKDMFLDFKPRNFYSFYFVSGSIHDKLYLFISVILE